MSPDDDSHAARVDTWLAEVRNLSAPEQRRLLERALTAVCRRARRTLGEVTLGAILDRVLYTAVEEYPELAGLALEGDRVRWGGEPPTAEVAADLESARFVLIELLTVLGVLTGGILTPALHAELANVKTAEINDGEDVT